MAMLYLGMIIACLVKEIQISTELRRMGDIGLVPQELDSLILQVQAFLSILIYQLNNSYGCVVGPAGVWGPARERTSAPSIQLI